MTDGGNNGNFTSIDASHYAFFIERPKIIRRPSSSAYDQNINIRTIVADKVDHRRDVRCRAIPLNQDGKNGDVYNVVSGAKYFQYISDCSSGLRSDNAHLFRKGRQRFLVRRIEKPFGHQLSLNFFQCGR